MKRIAVFAGSFDPITIGHVHIIKRALKMFDTVYVMIGVNPGKKYMFPLEDRLAYVQRALMHEPNVKVAAYDGFTADFCKEVGACAIIRGLRGGADFEYENMIAHANKKIYPNLETVFMMTDGNYIGISSSLVREMYSHGKDVSDMIPDGIVLPKYEN